MEVSQGDGIQGKNISNIRYKVAFAVALRGLGFYHCLSLIPNSRA